MVCGPSGFGFEKPCRPTNNPYAWNETAAGSDPLNKFLTPFFVATALLSGCQGEQPIVSSGACPQIPPTNLEPRGGAMASTVMRQPTPNSSPRHHKPIPQGPISSVRIVLERSACFGNCPDYRVELSGDGNVQFQGNEHVAVAGTHRSKISLSAVPCLLENFRAADFWSLDSEYIWPATDLPTYKISLTINGQTKTVTDYAGEKVGMPPVVTALEQAIDQAAQTETWITGNANTIATLEAEEFDFGSPAAGELLVRASTRAPDGYALALLERGAPVDAKVPIGYFEEPASAVEVAAMHGRLGLLKALIRRGAFSKGGKAVISATLRASVASQRADVVAEVLKYGPEVNDPDKGGDTALALIFTGAHPRAGDENWPDENVSIIRMLGKAGANPNFLTSSGDSILNHAYSKEEKAALVAIGAR